MSRQRRQIFNEINITPLTDIFLVLLIIMMVIAPMLDSQGLKLAVPTVGTSKEAAEEPKALTLHITASGQYKIEGQLYPAESLQQKIFQSKTQYPEGIIIETEPDATHGAVVKAMDAARGAGIEKLAVVQSDAGN